MTSVRVLLRVVSPDPTVAVKYQLCPLDVPNPGQFAASVRDWIRRLGKGRVMLAARLFCRCPRAIWLLVVGRWKRRKGVHIQMRGLASLHCCPR